MKSMIVPRYLRDLYSHGFYAQGSRVLTKGGISLVKGYLSRLGRTYKQLVHRIMFRAIRHKGWAYPEEIHARCSIL